MAVEFKHIVLIFFAQDDNNKIEIVFTHSNTMYEYKEVFNLFDKEIKNHSYSKKYFLHI